MLTTVLIALATMAAWWLLACALAIVIGSIMRSNGWD